MVNGFGCSDTDEAILPNLCSRASKAPCRGLVLPARHQSETPLAATVRLSVRQLPQRATSPCRSAPNQAAPPSGPVRVVESRRDWKHSKGNVLQNQCAPRDLLPVPRQEQGPDVPLLFRFGRPAASIR